MLCVKLSVSCIPFVTYSQELELRGENVTQHNNWSYEVRMWLNTTTEAMRWECDSTQQLKLWGENVTQHNSWSYEVRMWLNTTAEAMMWECDSTQQLKLWGENVTQHNNWSYEERMWLNTTTEAMRWECDSAQQLKLWGDNVTQHNNWSYEVRMWLTTTEGSKGVATSHDCLPHHCSRSQSAIPSSADPRHFRSLKQYRHKCDSSRRVSKLHLTSRLVSCYSGQAIESTGSHTKKLPPLPPKRPYMIHVACYAMSPVMHSSPNDVNWNS
jgi:hypothetical protein